MNEIELSNLSELLCSKIRFLNSLKFFDKNLKNLCKGIRNQDFF